MYITKQTNKKASSLSLSLSLKGLKKPSKFDKTSAFTLVELIVAIAVIGILAGIVIVSYNGWRKSTITTQVKSDLNGAASAMESARTFNNAYLASITSSTTFKPSQGVILSGGSSDGGKTYCIDASSTQDATIHYYIDSISGDAGAQAGTCATRSIPVLTATPASISSINLSWTAVPGATSYTLQIASSSTFADASTIATQSGLTFSSTGLLASTTYYYRVGVTTSTGLWSATQSATTTIAAPITPTVIANTSGSTTTWQWSAADCPTGTTGRYQYDYTISSGYDSGLAATGSTSISFDTSGQGNTYAVAVQAQCYNANASSAWSGVGSALYSRPVTAVPTNLIATTASSSSINISWNASAGATSYTLQRGSNSSFTDATTIATQAGLTFVSSGLSQGTSYYYRVQATDINGTSNWSTTATATTTIDAPAAPTVAANTSGATTTWSWNAASCAAGTVARYQYDYTISPAGYDSGWIAFASTSVAFTTSTEGQTYTVAVKAQCYNSSASSAWGSAGSAAYNRPVTAVAGSQTWTTPGTYTWTVPAGVTQLTVLCQGGGGGGGGDNASGQIGSSGGNGGLVLKTYTVSPGAVFTIIVGTGGLGAIWDTTPSLSGPIAGTASQVSASGYATLSAGGGNPGYSNFGTNTLNPPAGGTASGGDYNEIGASGRGTYNYYYTMGGAMTLFGAAGSSGAGSGGISHNGGAYHDGGNGGNGEVMINYSSGTHSVPTWTTPGTYTFTVPAGVTQLTVLCQGAGGGGGGNNASGQVGSSGGNGGLVLKKYTVTPGTVFNITVGSGGLGAIWDNTPSLSSPVAGTTSQVSASGYATLSAGGGTPGYSNFGTNTLNTPAGGTASGGDYNEIGASGGGVYNYYYTMGGAMTLFGAAGGSGIGDGGISHNGGAYHDGGNGGNGEVMINY